MSQSTNDITIDRMQVRLVSIPARRGQYDCKIYILHPKTGKCASIQELIDLLNEVATAYPHLAARIQIETEALLRKADGCTEKRFERSVRGCNKEESRKRGLALVKNDLKQLLALLSHPEMQKALAAGNITVSEYVALKTPETLFPEAVPSAREHMLSCLNSMILPVMGSEQLCNLDVKKQEKLLRKINRSLTSSNAGASKCGYTRRAYRALMEAIQADCSVVAGNPNRLSVLIETKRHSNTALLQAFTPTHMDASQRTTVLCALRDDPQLLYECFLVSLLYVGLDENEIAAGRFGEIELLETAGGEVYTYLVAAVMHKQNDQKRYSTISAKNDAFPANRLRRVVWPPWCAEILKNYVNVLLDRALTMDQISSMTFSTLPEGRPLYPKEITERIEALLPKIGLSGWELTRTSAENGEISTQRVSPGIGFLKKDAQYTAEHLCQLNPIDLHATFGFPRKESVEKSYLGLLTDVYAVARYHQLRRYSPFSTSLDAGWDGKTFYSNEYSYAQHHIVLQNITTTAQTVSFQSNYAIRATIKENPN